MKPVDETTMLRFASGEMSHAEEATFLCRCEMEPALWREAVLTVVEHRRLVSALSEFAVEEQPSPPVRTSPKSAKRPARAAAWRVAAVSAAMAAGFLLALLGIHWFTPTTHAGSVLPSPTMAVAEAASAPQAVPDGRPPRGPTAVAANREPANALANGSELAGDAALHDAVGSPGDGTDHSRGPNGGPPQPGFPGRGAAHRVHHRCGKRTTVGRSHAAGHAALCEALRIGRRTSGSGVVHTPYPDPLPQGEREVISFCCGKGVIVILSAAKDLACRRFRPDSSLRSE